MTQSSFWRLHQLLEHSLEKSFSLGRGINPRHISRIDSAVRLSVAIRFFAGGSYLDIHTDHGIGRSSMYESVWAVVDAINNFPS